MNVLFLDIDGVLNYDFNNPYKWKKNICEKLNEVLLKYDIKIIITSTWRLHFSIPELQEIFKNNYISTNIISCTQSNEFGAGGRGSEIKSYLDDNKHITKYCIVDDNIEHIIDIIPTNVIGVEKSYIGLTLKNIEDIESIFNI